MPREGSPFLDIFSLGRPGPSGRFTPDQIDYIRRTVSRTPEVMVKVTGGGTRTGAVAAHFAYISRKGELAIETDEGYRVAGRDAQKAFLNDWHLELLAGQYRGPRDGRATARKVKLVHNIVLSMPFPTHRKRSWWLPGNSHARSSRFSTDTRWCYTPISRTRMFIWSSRLKARTADGCTSIKRCCATGARISHSL